MLLPHERGQTITAEAMEGVYDTIEHSFRNLSAMSELWSHVEDRSRYWPEFPLRFAHAGALIEVRLDLMFFRAFGKPTIIDWKVYESMSGSDTHLQMALYAWAMCRHGGWSVQHAEDIELLEVQLLTPEVVRYQVSDEAFEELEDEIFRSLDEIHSLCGSGRFRDQDMDDFAFANNPNNCSFCAFHPVCTDISGKEPFVSDVSVSVPLQGVLF